MAGIVGNFSYHVFTILARNLLKLIKGDKEKDKYAEIIRIVTDDEELKLFFQYVSDYYWQRPSSNPEVNKSIEEEVLADFISNSMSTNGIQRTFEMNDEDEASKLRLEIIKKAYKDWQEYKETKKQMEKKRLNELLKEVKTTPNNT